MVELYTLSTADSDKIPGLKHILKTQNYVENRISVSRMDKYFSIIMKNN